MKFIVGLLSLLISFTVAILCYKYRLRDPQHWVMSLPAFSLAIQAFFDPDFKLSFGVLLVLITSFVGLILIVIHLKEQ